jgi:arsenite transporter
MLKVLQKNLGLAVPFFMIIGFFLGLVIDDPSPLSHLIMPLTFFMVYPMMVTMQFRKILEGGDFKVQATAQFINFGIIPFLAFLLGKVFFAEAPYLALGFLLVSLLPTSGMTISWTGMAKGNMEAAVKMTVIGLLLGSFLAPFYIRGLMGTAVSVPLVKIISQILIIVALPMLLGGLTQAFLVKKYGNETFQKDVKKRFPPVSTLGVLLMVFTAMVLKAKSIVADPMTFLGLILPLVLLYALNIIISTIVARLFFNREDGLALVFGTVLRNLSVALAIGMTSFGREGSEIALVIALGYIIQIQVSALYVKKVDRIFIGNNKKFSRTAI